ncbi:hypothetical protein EK21DRAFT_95456 [Setomelanomma holmii]|uniref:Uncharacterized protein n=1 Tax=Setomelanomma holmii TaxID=210430 RepID=A0A9P4LG09_9PLEO|nr:hypothetical protein EK21DRAFT_95456 [Setomelanomma holmii]
MYLTQYLHAYPHDFYSAGLFTRFFKLSCIEVVEAVQNIPSHSPRMEMLQDIAPSLDGGYSHDCQNPSRHEYKSWKGWTIGSYVHARRPTHAHVDFPWDGQSWDDYPVLIVDVWKDDIGAAQFVVAHLYTCHMAFQRLLKLGEWIGVVSLLWWPHKFKYVLSNHFEIVYECQLRIWTRSKPPSVALPWMFNTRINRLGRSVPSPHTDIGRALDFEWVFPQFLRLPREIRDCIYENALSDERQQSHRSRIYVRSILRGRNGGGRCELSRSLCTPALGPLPRIQTPAILCISRQVRRESLDIVYSTKILVVTITSAQDGFDVLGAKQLPEVHHFWRVRFDLVLFYVTSDIVRICLRDVANLLRTHVLRPKFVEIRIGHSHLDHSAETSERAYLDMLIDTRTPTFMARDVSTSSAATPSNSGNDIHRIAKEKEEVPRRIADGMHELSTLCHEQAQTEGKRPLQVSWGISEEQKRAGDYSCVCTYLCASYLQRLWSCICNDAGEDTYDDVVLSEETCQQMGCKLHRY